MMDLQGGVHWRCHPRCKLLINDLKKVKTDEKGKLDKQNLALTHACLVAGTMIATTEGEIPIEDIRKGMFVLTRQGPKPVEWAGMTGRDTDVARLRCSNGRDLVGTENHKIWVKEAGFVPLGSLQYSNVLYSIIHEEIEQWRQRRLFTGASRITRPRENGTFPTPSVEGSTGKYGLMNEGRFHQDITSITKTAIHQIMQSRILSAYQDGNICRTTAGTPRSLKDGERSLIASGICPPIGIDQQRAGHGIESMLNELASAIILSKNNVFNARVNLLPSREEILIGSAPANARPRPAERVGLTTKHAYAKFAAPSSLLTSTRKPDAAPVHVVSVCGGQKRADVYDITVCDAHEFFANGILVHNSDAEGYRVEYLRPARVQSRESIGGRIGYMKTA